MKKKKVLFVSSIGGHLTQLLELKPLFKDYKYFFINVLNAFHSVFLFFKFRPDVIVTTGANTCVPLCYMGFIFRKKVIYIESFAKQEGKTLSGKLVYPIATHFIVQWESMKKYYPKAIYIGGIY